MLMDILFQGSLSLQFNSMSQALIHYCMSIHKGMGCKWTQRKTSTLMTVKCGNSQFSLQVIAGIVVTFIGSNIPLEAVIRTKRVQLNQWVNLSISILTQK